MYLPDSAKLSCMTSVLLGIVLNLTAVTGLSQDVAGARVAPAPPTTSPAPDSLEIRLAEARADLAAASGGGKLNVPAGVSADDALLRRVTLERLVRLYEGQAAENEALETAKQAQADAAREAQAWTGFAQPQPYSILLKDSIREQIQAAQTRISSAESAQKSLQQLIDAARPALAQSEGAIRKLNESIEGAKNPVTKSALVWQRDFERIKSRVTAASIASLDVSLQIGRKQAEEAASRLGLLQRQSVIAGAGAVFTQADLDTVMARLDSEQQQLQEEMAAAMQQYGQTRAAMDIALAALQATRQAIPPQDAAGRSRQELLTETADLRRAQMNTQGIVMAALRTEQDIVTSQRAMWESRYAMATETSARTLLQASLSMSQLSQRVQLWKDYYRQRNDVVAKLIDQQQGRINGMDRSSELVPLIRQRLQSFEECNTSLHRTYRSAERFDRLLQRWDEDMRDIAAALPLTERLSNLFSDAGAFAGRMWGFELFTAEDTITVDGQAITGKRSVTIGKVIQVLLILIIGYWITGLLARLVERLVAKRFKIDANQANLIRRWLRALLLMCLLVFSLVSVRIPLTAFAFGGGALAIALGFGTQTILKNLVSGVIILFEKPFKVGDVLDIGGNCGTVTSIGLRASGRQLWDNTEMLIPNSDLLENRLTNWTYSSHSVRFTISLGVAYGSDTRLVVRVLSEVAERHGLVAKVPKPQVFFTAFGESTLSFELRFWVDVLKDNPAQVSSDLRQMIATSFAEHRIVIAFPQRDLRLDVSRPLQVQMVAPDGVAAHEEARVVPDADR